MATEDLSLKLYECLCSLSGSENAVRKRRLFFKTLDCLGAIDFPGKQIRSISSGSKAEGLDFDGSDFDIMYLLKKFPVNVESMNRSNGYEIVVDINHSSPGFAVLKVQNDLDINLFASMVYTDYGILLSSDKVKAYFKSISNILKHTGIQVFEKHGPCISLIDMTLDVAFCLQCQTWPSFASGWLTRPRSKWPSVDQMAEIKEQGVLFVPIGDSDKSETNPHEWRISFSMAEKLLIHSFNHTQLLCYALLKFVLKEIINTNSDTKNVLCSYFMKTVLFWEIEINEALVWEPRNIVECYKHCFRRLVYFVRCGYCPNYFMPDNNIFRNKIFGRTKTKMERLLNCLLSEGIASFQRSKSLKNFACFQLSRNIGKREETNRAILRLMNLFTFSSSISLIVEHGELLSLLLMKIRKANECKLTIVSELLLLCLALCSRMKSIKMKYDFKIKNKKFYVQRKTCLLRLLIGKNLDNVSGWLQIAAFFWQHKQYNQALFAVDYALGESRKDKILIWPLKNIDKSQIFEKTFNLSFLSNHKLLCMHNIGEVVLPLSFLDEGNTFVPGFFSETFSNHLVYYISRSESLVHQLMNTSHLSDILSKVLKPLLLKTMKRSSEQCAKVFIQGSPVVFGRYLRFLRAYYLRNSGHVREEMYKLRSAVDEHSLSNLELYSANYIWLFKAMDLTGDHEKIIPNFLELLDETLNKDIWFNSLLKSLA